MQLKCGTGLKESDLTMEGYYNQFYPGDFSKTNASFQKRLTLASKSKSIEYVGKMCDTIFLQERYIYTKSCLSYHRLIKK